MKTKRPNPKKDKSARRVRPTYAKILSTDPSYPKWVSIRETDNEPIARPKPLSKAAITTIVNAASQSNANSLPTISVPTKRC